MVVLRLSLLFHARSASLILGNIARAVVINVSISLLDDCLPSVPGTAGAGSSVESPKRSFHGSNFLSTNGATKMLIEMLSIFLEVTYETRISTASKWDIKSLNQST